MPRRVIENQGDVISFTRFLNRVKLPITLEWVTGRDRSGEQNALQWLWAGEVAQQLGDRDAADVQAEWKLRHGVPILRAESPEFRETYDRLLKPRSYEDKIAAMRDLGISVSSIMRVRQMVRYMDAIQRETLSMGLVLTDTDPSLAKYQNRYRQKEAA